MLNWKPCELHCHTLHSDGIFTVESLLETARADGLSLIALTDHNTFSGWQDLSEELEARTVPVIRGMEWTTYFGHMVVLGCKEFVDWRWAVPDNIDEKMLEVKKAGGVIGIAHPAALGPPYCTGGYWEYHVRDWNLPDYFEISSEADPMRNVYNVAARRWWTKILDGGAHLAATHGKDWHKKDETRLFDGFTLLGFEEGEAVSAAAALNAIRKGRTMVSTGLTMAVSFETGDGIFTVGDTVSRTFGQLTVQVELEPDRKKITEGFEVVPQTLRVFTKGGKLAAEVPLAGGEAAAPISFEGYFYLEISGTVKGREQVLLISSPVYQG